MVNSSVSVCPSVLHFQVTPPTVFHCTMLTLCGQLEYKVIQRILFQGYSIPNFDKSYYAF